MNQKLAEARVLAARKMPYMTHQVMTLIPVERPGLGTMAVDEYCRLYFDPAFLESRDLKHLAFVVLHEAIHVWSRHAKRCVRLLGEKPAPVVALSQAALERFKQEFNGGPQLPENNLAQVLEILRSACRSGRLEGATREIAQRWIASLCPLGPVLGAGKL